MFANFHLHRAQFGEAQELFEAALSFKPKLTQRSPRRGAFFMVQFNILNCTKWLSRVFIYNCWFNLIRYFALCCLIKIFWIDVSFYFKTTD